MNTLIATLIIGNVSNDVREWVVVHVLIESNVVLSLFIV